MAALRFAERPEEPVLLVWRLLSGTAADGSRALPAAPRKAPSSGRKAVFQKLMHLV